MNFNKLPIWAQSLPYGGDNDDGSSGQGTGNTSGNSGQQSNDQGNQGNSGQGNESGSGATRGAKTSGNDDDPYDGLSAKELKRLLADAEDKSKTFETERDSYKTKVDEQERSQRTREENLDTDLKNARAENDSLKGVNARLAITNEILKDKTHSWHNVDMVAAQLNSDVVKVGDDGKVSNLAKELKRIATDHPYLLANNQQQQQNTNQGFQQQSGPTGFQPGQGGAKEGSNAQELAKKFPALASRII